MNKLTSTNPHQHAIATARKLHKEYKIGYKHLSDRRRFPHPHLQRMALSLGASPNLDNQAAIAVILGNTTT